jgi:hypothetical protein
MAVSATPSQAPRPVLHALLVVPFAPASLRGNATRSSRVHDAVLYGFELLWLIRLGREPSDAIPSLVKLGRRSGEPFMVGDLANLARAPRLELRFHVICIQFQ